MDWITFAEFSLIGLFSGGLLTLVALGFVLIYKGTRAINFATGEFMMLGAYLVYTGHSWLKMPLWLSVVFGLAGISLVAIVVERFVLRPLAGQPVVSVLMVTIGLGAFLHGMVDAIWGGQNLEMPQMLPRKPLIWGDIMLPGAVFWSFWVALAVIAGLSLYFRYSRTGIAMRAAASDPITAYALGIDVRRIQWRRVVDMNDRALRDVVVSLGGTANGYPREDGFDIVVASEVMAILCLAESLADLKSRLAAIVFFI